MKSFTRRAFLGFAAPLALLVSGLLRTRPARADDDLVIVNGWVLRKSDLTRYSR